MSLRLRRRSQQAIACRARGGAEQEAPPDLVFYGDNEGTKRAAGGIHDTSFNPICWGPRTAPVDFAAQQLMKK